MSAGPRLCVLPLDAVLRPRVAALDVLPAQRPFVGTVGDLLADLDHSSQALGMVVLQANEPIGFYRIDLHARSVAGRDFEQQALGLRGFFIDARWQRRGFGARALGAMLGDLELRLPWARLLVLGVSRDNAAAVRLYQNAGFDDDGQLYDGGPTGAQLLMLRPLP